MEDLLIAVFVIMFLGAVASGPLGLLIGLWSAREVGRLRREFLAQSLLEPRAVAVHPSEPRSVQAPPTDSLSAPADAALEAPPVAALPLEDAPEHPAAVVTSTSHPSRWQPSPEQAAMWIAASLGGLLVVVASLLALSVAIERGWLGPSGRVCLGLLGGTGLWIGGAEMARRRYRWLSAALSGSGMGALYGSLFAAAGLYDLTPDWLAFIFMCAVTGVSMLKADRDNDRFMALLGLIGGLLTPMLITTGGNRALELFAYLTLLSCGSLLVATRRGWWDLIGTAAIGVAGLYLSWADRWHVMDQVPMALIGVSALSAPFALAAARATGPARAVAWLAALTLPALALPWITPIDPMFVDPQTGLVIWRAGGGAVWATAAVALLPLPLWWASRGIRWAGAATTGLWALLVMVHALGWAEHDAPSVAVQVAGLLIPLLLGVLVRPGPSKDGALLPLPIIAGLGISVLLVAHPPDGRLLVLTALGMVGLSLLSGARSGQRWWAMTGLAGAGLILNTAAHSVADIGPPWVAAATLLAYAPLAVVPLSRRWMSAGAGPSLASALAGPVLFLPLYRSWQLSTGDVMIGILPALLGAVALLNAAVLVRLYRTDRSSGILAVFVGVALLGVSAAVPLQLERAWLTVAWAAEAAALAALSRRLSHPLVRAASIVLMATVGVRLLMNPVALTYGNASGLPVLNWTLYTWGIPLIASLLAARWLHRDDAPNHASTGLRLLACALGFALINVQVSHAFQATGPIELGGSSLVQGMVRSLAWAAYGGAVLGLGLYSGNRHTRLVGFAVVLLATAKVFAFDLWSLAGMARVGSAMGLGVTLLTAAFLFERLVLRQPAQEGDLR